jgi:hypothetical protein
MELFTRAKMRAKLFALYRACLPLVREPLLESYIHWTQALAQCAPFRQRFYGPVAIKAAAQILAALSTWSDPVSTVHMAQQQQQHPFCLILHGHHGVGKSSLVQFVFNDLLDWNGWGPFDFCFQPTASVIEWMRNMASRKAQINDELFIQVLENAETTIANYGFSFAPMVGLVQEAAAVIKQGHQIPNRLIVVTSTLGSWMRALVHQASASVVFVKALDMDPVDDVPWGRWLREAEGVPGRAICLDYANRRKNGNNGTSDNFNNNHECISSSLGQCDTLYDSLGAVSQLICQGKLGVAWWDATETLLSSHKTALFQLKYRCAHKAKTLRDRVQCLVDA